MSVQEILSRLVAFQTVCQTSNDSLIKWVESYLRPLGARIQQIPGDHPGRSSLVATFGPEGSDGIVLSGHSDVVPVEGQPWTTDPFELTLKDGKLLGRGSSDMKGFIACMLVGATTASKRRNELKRPLHLALSYDEEVGCVGIHSLLRTLKEQRFQARGCIIGEPTLLNVISGHKGKLAVKVTCHGHSAHSSNPAKGTSAILMAADLVQEIEKIHQDTAVSGVKDETYEVPHSTLQVGVINGGVAVNIVPDHCEFLFEMRVVPGAKPDYFVNLVRDAASKLTSTKYPKGTIDVQELNGYPSLHTADSNAFLKEVMTIRGKSTAGRVGFGTEGGLFQEYLGIPVAVCGPGSIDRAHKADEYVLPSELDDGVKFVEAIIESLTR